MAETITKHERNLSAFIHGATLGRFFFPLGQFLFPLLFWLPNRKQYAFVDYHGKQALNFQISMALYALVIGMISFPFFLGFLPRMHLSARCTAEPALNLRCSMQLPTVSTVKDSA